MEKIKYLEFGGSLLYYVKSGAGDQSLITFHGFGQSAKDFKKMETAFPAHTFYHFGLFFHQGFLHKAHRPLTPDIWLKMFARFLKEENIERFSLAGFSIGCRLIYDISESFAHQIDSIILLAPEGDQLSSWYRAGVTTFRRIFKYIIFYPDLFFSILDLLVKIKVLNNHVARFARSQMKSRNKRWQVYMTWIHFRLLRFSLTQWVAIINQQQIPVTIMVGDRDLVIPAKKAKTTFRKINKLTFYQIRSGHQELVKNSADFLINLNK